MTVKAYTGGIPVYNVKTFDIRKDKLDSGAEYIRIRINPTGDLYSDVEFTLWPEDDTFKDIDLDSIPDLYKE